MKTDNIFDYYRKMEETQVILAYDGLISDKILTGILEALNIRMTQSNIEKKIRKRIFSILIELAQNSALYSDVPQKGIIIVREYENYYQINSGNMLRNIKIHALVSKVNYINRLDSSELKKLYLKKLRTPNVGGKTGGNMGLIFIVRKSGNPINLTIHSVNKEQSFIEFSVNINKKEV